MLTPIKMPRLGESVAEGTVGSWLKNEGDWVEKDESLAEVITDKINAELPSPVAGRLTKILVKADETVPVGADIALIEENADVSSSPPAEAAPIESPARANVAVMDDWSAGDSNGSRAATQVSHTGEEERQRISPLARRLAREHAIDLNAIAGTGAGGRVRKGDILAYVAQRQTVPTAAAVAQPTVVAPSAQPVYTPPTSPAPAPVEAQLTAPAAPTMAGPGEEVIKPSRMRLAIAEPMGHGNHTSPAPTATVQDDITNIPKLLRENKNNLKNPESSTT